MRFTAAILFAVAMVSSTVTASIYPIWCVCESSSLTAQPCNAAGGNYDGGSCGLTNSGKCNKFQSECRSEQHQSIRCWDQNNSPTNC